MSRYKLALIVVFLIAAGSAGGFLYLLDRSFGPDPLSGRASVNQSVAPEAASEPRFELPRYDGYRVTEVLAGPAVKSVRLGAIVEPIRSATVSPVRPGIVREVLVSENVRVGPGVPLARLESADLELDVAEQEALLRDRQRDYLRLKTRAAFETITKEELASAKAAYEDTRGKLERAKKLLDQMTIRSPIEGTIMSRDIEVGQSVSVGDALFMIGGLDHLIIAANGSKEQVAAVSPGDRVIVLQEGSDNVFESTVTSVSKHALSPGGGRVFVEMPRKARFAAGSPHDVVIVTEQESGFVIPVTALVDGRFSWLAEPVEGSPGQFTLTRVPVKADLIGDSAVSVSDGLVAGDYVVVNPDQAIETTTPTPARILFYPYDEVQSYIIRSAAQAAAAGNTGGCGGPAPAAGDEASGALAGCPAR